MKDIEKVLYFQKQTIMPIPFLGNISNERFAIQNNLKNSKVYMQKVKRIKKNPIGKIHFNYPSWLENILKFTVMEWLKM